MNRQSINVLLPVCAAAILAAAQAALAIPSINPPPGPVTVSGRFGPRYEITQLPFSINQPGSYYLTRTLTGSSGNGITVNVGDVALDLNGFALIGVPGSTSGISVPASISNLSVRNGTIRDWGSSGVDASAATNSRAKHLQLSNNGSAGLSIGYGGLVTSCTAKNNGAIGISTYISSAVVDCTASDNVGAGIFVSYGSTVRGCSAYSNDNAGIYASGGSVVAECSAYANGIDGIFASDSCTVQACSAYYNVDDGIEVGTSCTLSDCASAQNSDAGFAVGYGCTIRNASAYVNGSDGITAGSNCTITDCTLSSNTGDGIEANARCRIVNNNSHGNGFGAGDAAGIHLIGSNSRIEANNTSLNDRGIDVDSAGNIIMRNTASNNTTNYEIAASNVVGVIVQGTLSGAISGSTGGSGVGTTDPTANFSY